MLKKVSGFLLLLYLLSFQGFYVLAGVEWCEEKRQIRASRPHVGHAGVKHGLLTLAMPPRWNILAQVVAKDQLARSGQIQVRVTKLQQKDRSCRRFDDAAAIGKRERQPPRQAVLSRQIFDQGTQSPVQ